MAAKNEPPATASPMLDRLNPDFRDLLAALVAAQAKFIVVGAHALAAFGSPRATGDLDVWVEPTPANAARVWQALLDFGAPVTALGVDQDDLERPDQVVQFGLPPRRIDLLTSITGVGFDEAWARKVTRQIGHLVIPFLAREDLIRNKRATGRSKDLADLEALE